MKVALFRCLVIIKINNKLTLTVYYKCITTASL